MIRLHVSGCPGYRKVVGAFLYLAREKGKGLIHGTTLSNREIIRHGMEAVKDEDTLSEKVEAIAHTVQAMGHETRITTRMIIRQLRMAGRA